MSTFVYGKAHKLVGPAWYLILSGRKEQDMVATILRDNCARFCRDPHYGPESAMKAFASMQMAMEVDLGFTNRMGFHVNKNGGMCSKLAEVIKTVEVDTWPELERITISQWPGAKHFYVRVDGGDVIWKGQSKWNTHKAAERAGIAYMAQKETKR